jgi:hypothetical protein
LVKFGFIGSFLEFHIIVCGLDSIVARRWTNGMVVSFSILCTTMSATLKIQSKVWQQAYMYSYGNIQTAVSALVHS